MLTPRPHDLNRRAALEAALFFVYLVLLATVITAPDAGAKMRRESLILQTVAARHVIEIEVAESMEEKSLGLMFRPTVPDGTGMLFPYGPPQEITMWMKNTYTSLDMVFIRPDGIIHRIEARTEPMSERTIGSNGPVSAVLELKAGAAERMGLKAGDRVLHKSFGTAAK